VVATDAAPRALALTVGNAAANGVPVSLDKVRPGHITPAIVDWHSDATVAMVVARHGPADVVLGAALKFETWAGRLWGVLGTLTGSRPRATAALVHTAGVVGRCVGGTVSPDCEVAAGWRVARRVPGDAHGMAALHGGPSEFDVAVLESSAPKG